MVQDMTTQLRENIDQSKPEVNLSGAVEYDEVYVTIRHKSKPEEVKKKGAKEGVIASRGFGSGERLKEKKHPSLAGFSAAVKMLLESKVH